MAILDSIGEFDLSMIYLAAWRALISPFMLAFLLTKVRIDLAVVRGSLLRCPNSADLSIIYVPQNSKPSRTSLSKLNCVDICAKQSSGLATNSRSLGLSPGQDISIKLPSGRCFGRTVQITLLLLKRALALGAIKCSGRDSLV